MVKVFGRYGAKNLYLDLSASIFFYDEGPEQDRLKWYMEKAPDIVLFASDVPARVGGEPLPP